MKSFLPFPKVEHVLHMLGPDENEKNLKKHFEAFKSLKDFGFDTKAIHKALHECDCDRDKALEKLLK